MKKIWYCDEGEVCFTSKEVAIESIKTYFKEKLTCENIVVKQVSSSQYHISGVRSKGIHFIEHAYIFEIPICENAEDFIKVQCDADFDI